MKANALGLVWITVKDFKQAIKFYTEIAGLQIKEVNEEWGWAELEGHEGGMRLGIGKQQPGCQELVAPGGNAVMTLTVDSLEDAIEELQNKGATLIGKMEVVPGHVKMQAVKDTEGNIIQFVEIITANTCATNDHGCGCH